MANNFDQFPVYDDLTKSGTDRMSDVWVDFIGTFTQNLQGYLGQFGIFVPNITESQRESIQSPQNGQMIYNVTSETLQVWKAGSWKTVTTS